MTLWPAKPEILYRELITPPVEYDSWLRESIEAAEKGLGVLLKPPCDKESIFSWMKGEGRSMKNVS